MSILRRSDARNMLRNNWLTIKSLIVASSWSHFYLLIKDARSLEHKVCEMNVSKFPLRYVPPLHNIPTHSIYQLNLLVVLWRTKRHRGQDVMTWRTARLLIHTAAVSLDMYASNDRSNVGPILCHFLKLFCSSANNFQYLVFKYPRTLRKTVRKIVT